MILQSLEQSLTRAIPLSLPSLSLSLFLALLFLQVFCLSHSMYLKNKTSVSFPPHYSSISLPLSTVSFFVCYLRHHCQHYLPLSLPLSFLAIYLCLNCFTFSRASSPLSLSLTYSPSLSLTLSLTLSRKHMHTLKHTQAFVAH